MSGDLKAVLDSAAKNALTMVADQILEAMKSCAIGCSPNSIETAVPVAASTICDK